MTYTNNSSEGLSENSIVLNGVYALKQSSVDEQKSEFQINTRTEWRVLYVNALDDDLSETNIDSPMPVVKELKNTISLLPPSRENN